MRLNLVDVGFQYPRGAPLFEHVNLTLTPGTITAFTGPSGSGKSTLLMLLAGAAMPTQGTVTSAGIRTTAWVFQNPVGTPRRSAVDHVTLPLLAQSRAPNEADASAQQLLDRFGLHDVAHREFRQLSGGQAQRLMLARAVATQPDLLLIDEPTAQLDSSNAQTVIDVVHEVAQAHSIVVVATHDARLAAQCHTRVQLGLA
ncbi:ATP-binding cassette domain-containing protein [Marisediminicola antarctica]|uniref:ATP-binding cassette domain-containing protein n=1 Tax=Marisediminicola antarctica TaxID=674079 RepID=UPI00137AF537